MVVSPSGTASRLRIRLCGGLAVDRDGERLEDRLPSRQARILFACLVDRRGHPVSRTALAEALWGDHPPAARDAGLRAVLSGVRRPLGPDSLRGRGELELDLPDDVWIDVEVAAEHLDRAEREMDRGRPEAAQEEAARAADILQDEFLPGCGGPWVDERRAELEELGRHARELEASAALAMGDAAGAERVARRLVERAPYRESAHGVLMEALAAQGNVAEALLAYDRLLRVLRDDLGTVPTPALATFHEQLLVNGHAVAPARPRSGARRRRPGPRGVGIALACAGIALVAIGLVGDDASGGARHRANRMLPTQEAVLSAQRVAFRYPKDWPLRAPTGGLTGTGNGDTFCNIFRVPGAARPGWTDADALRYARARMRAWERRGRGQVGAVHAIRGEEQAGATALETDSAYGERERGRVTFFTSGRDVLRIECSSPPGAFNRVDRAVFRPLVHSFRTLDG